MVPDAMDLDPTILDDRFIDHRQPGYPPLDGNDCVCCMFIFQLDIKDRCLLIKNRPAMTNVLLQGNLAAKFGLFILILSQEIASHARCPERLHSCIKPGGRLARTSNRSIGTSTAGRYDQSHQDRHSRKPNGLTQRSHSL